MRTSTDVLAGFASDDDPDLLAWKGRCALARTRALGQQRADELHRRFTDPTSDFLAWLNLWNYVREQQAERGSSSFRRMCREEHLNHMRIREWQELERQLRQLAREMKLTPGRPADKPDADGIHQALLSGLLSHIGLHLIAGTSKGPAPRGRTSKGEYLGARGAHFAIFPGSGLFKKPPEFVMAGELVETGRLWARQNAAIDPLWAEQLGSHLVKRSHAEPHWSRKRAAVMARERVTLYGVPLVADRLVNLARTDPGLSRELFIRHALVEGDWHTRHPFMAANRKTLEEAEELEHRARRRGIVVDDDVLYDFYAARVPEEVVSGAHFDQWWKQARRDQPDLLAFDLDMLVNEDTSSTHGAFPDVWRTGHHELPVRYRFDPGERDDGVTIDIPVATLNTMSQESFSWHVPGMREELVIALIRGLPKNLRVNFVPVPDVAREFLRTATPGEESLTVSLSRFLRSRSGVHVPAEAWSFETVAPHLRPTFRVVDGDGLELSRGRDLTALKAPLQKRLEAAITDLATAQGSTATRQRTWSFGRIEESFSTVQAGQEVTGYPALIDEGSAVGLRVLGSPATAAAHHRLGVRRLLRLATKDPAAVLAKRIDNPTKLALAASPYPNVKALLSDLSLGALTDLVDLAGDVRDPAAFADLVDAAQDLEQRTAAAIPLLVELLSTWREVDGVLHGRVEPHLLHAMTDLQARVAHLVRAGFLGDAGIGRIQDVNRYLKALGHRHSRLGDLDRDRRAASRIDHLQRDWEHRIAALPESQPPPANLRRAGWLLEEFRVSLWAEQFGTREKVSEQRISRLLDQR